MFWVELIKGIYFHIQITDITSRRITTILDITDWPPAQIGHLTTYLNSLSFYFFVDKMTIMLTLVKSGLNIT